MTRTSRPSASPVKSRFAAKAAVSATAAIPKTTGNSAQREAATKIAPTAVAKARVGRTKVRKTLTLDPELVLAFGDVEGGLSAAVNAALREHLARVKRQDALAARIAELEAEYGPADAVDVERFARHMR